MYSMDGRVRYSEIDADEDLSLLALVDYLQDCATFQSQDLGHGFDYMAKNHFSWLLAAWQIEILDLPRFAQAIRTSTWCYGGHGLYAYRNFTMVGPDGHEYVRADSIWFVLDTRTGLPTRIPAEEFDVYYKGEARLDMPRTERKLHVVGDGRQTRPVVVNEQHLDTNHHVNNAQYIEMARGALSETDYARSLRGVRLCVQYQRAAVLGDVIVPSVHEEADGLTVDLASTDGTSFAVVKASKL